MSVQRATFTRPLIAVAMVAVSTLSALAQRAPVPTRVRGTIESVNGDTIQVKARSGEDVKLHIASDVNVSGITRISLADIKPGSFVGATTVPGPDGGANAVEVHVFPESMRGTGEGSRPYDLKPNSSMTNATVSESVVGNDGHTLLVKYKDGEKKVFVADNTPVVTFVPGDRSDLKAGAKVIAFMKQLPDGSFETNRVSVGRDGLTPPM
ncbi:MULTISPECIES: hypothetical protein [Bradyrhizobium]|uniref:DUF5666 domain-containing protein n=1 Tax=Bradyrhizobium canariense TaxID=255045 RepID=A0A1X3GQG8_9BRAD|nr:MULTISPECIES: hypothetical protein [Bradyrhizobium]OSI68350.1 hypothetical protein BSZ22_22030 [Bradyrhizobium canariense]OSI81428.1 hypothetical protein BSZ23_06660 [Bradyrhizobium canariense]OSI95074.1 hypothetical protein BSZ25_05205 [Bradyrhizobium canariense]OSI95372.1 hypothetical protein BSZ24_07790 [Bradyrhizobium canariense]OSJ02635.1 hypothetical protein BSZ16_17925 [Bradyrhizobium canariense]